MPVYRPRFKSRCRQVGGSVLIQQNLGNLIHPISPAPSNPTTPACKALQRHDPRSPAAPEGSMTKEAALVNLDYVQEVLIISGSKRAAETGYVG